MKKKKKMKWTPFFHSSTHNKDWNWGLRREKEEEGRRLGVKKGAKWRSTSREEGSKDRKQTAAVSPCSAHTPPTRLRSSLSPCVRVCVLKRAICPSYTHTTHEAAAMLVSRSPSSSLRSRSVTRNVTSNRPVANVQTGTIRWDAHPLLEFLGCVSRHW